MLFCRSAEEQIVLKHSTLLCKINLIIKKMVYCELFCLNVTVILQKGNRFDKTTLGIMGFHIHSKPDAAYAVATH